VLVAVRIGTYIDHVDTRQRRLQGELTVFADTCGSLGGAGEQRGIRVTQRLEAQRESTPADLGIIQHQASADAIVDGLERNLNPVGIRLGGTDDGLTQIALRGTGRRFTWRRAKRWSVYGGRYQSVLSDGDARKLKRSIRKHLGRVRHLLRESSGTRDVDEPDCRGLARRITRPIRTLPRMVDATPERSGSPRALRNRRRGSAVQHLPDL